MPTLKRKIPTSLKKKPLPKGTHANTLEQRAFLAATQSVARTHLTGIERNLEIHRRKRKILKEWKAPSRDHLTN